MPLAQADVADSPPVQRLTASQIRAAGAPWRARGRAGDESAQRVADALEWLAERRASEEPNSLKLLAGRISAWMGLHESASSRRH